MIRHPNRLRAVFSGPGLLGLVSRRRLLFAISKLISNIWIDYRSRFLTCQESAKRVDPCQNRVR
ncbi:hypothetical protein PSAB6_60017 [Paraburkholderia sabiae]|nr:hypothetical protein PSAB6_60017 [Paraburkholderia sabiae]